MGFTYTAPRWQRAMMESQLMAQGNQDLAAGMKALDEGTKPPDIMGAGGGSQAIQGMQGLQGMGAGAGASGAGGAGMAGFAAGFV